MNYDSVLSSYFSIMNEQYGNKRHYYIMPSQVLVTEFWQDVKSRRAKTL